MVVEFGVGRVGWDLHNGVLLLRRGSSDSHHPNVADDGAEFHVVQDVFLNVNSRSCFDEFQSVRSQTKDGSFGDKQHIATAFSRSWAAEGDLFDMVDEFGNAAFVSDPQVSVMNLHGQAAGGQSAAEDETAGVL